MKADTQSVVVMCVVLPQPLYFQLSFRYGRTSKQALWMQQREVGMINQMPVKT